MMNHTKPGAGKCQTLSRVAWSLAVVELLIGVTGHSFRLFGQPQQATTLAFEVASLREYVPAAGGGDSGGGISVIGNSLKALTSLRDLIMYAYDVKDYAMSRGGPNAAVLDTIYDVSAKASTERAPTRDEMREMLRTLLAERFKLVVHKES